MKKAFSIWVVLLALCAGVVSSCSKDDDGDGNNVKAKIVGTWKQVVYNYTDLTAPDYSYLIESIPFTEFRADGTIYERDRDNGSSEKAGTYTVEGSTLTTKYNDSPTLKYIVVFTGSRMEWQKSNGDVAQAFVKLQE
jgi:hypothetical protein